MLLPSVLGQDGALSPRLVVLFLGVVLLLQHLQLGGLGKQVDVHAFLVRLPGKQLGLGVLACVARETNEVLASVVLTVEIITFEYFSSK